MTKKVDKSGRHISNGYREDLENAISNVAKDKGNPTKHEILRALVNKVFRLHPIQMEEYLRSIDLEKYGLGYMDLLEHSNTTLNFNKGDSFGSITRGLNKLRGEGFFDFENDRIEKLHTVIEKLIAETNTRKLSFDKIRFNGNTNRLWKYFNDLLDDGSLDTSKANLMRMITEVFLDKNGKEISMKTLETYSKAGKKMFTEPKKPHRPTKNKKG